MERLRQGLGREDRHGVLRIAFVGQRLYFGPAALPDGVATPGVHSVFIDFLPGSDASSAGERLRRFDPDVMIAFRPDVIPEALLRAGSGLVVGYFTEPLPYPGRQAHPDLMRRWDELRGAPTGGCDLYLGFNPIYREALEALYPIWCYMPLPVCDDVFAPVEEVRVPDVGTGIFVGRVTAHRERMLQPLKHRYNWTVIDHGVLPALESFTIALNLHNERYANFENRIPMHLARGQLVLSESVYPAYELQDEINICFFDDRVELEALVARVATSPDEYLFVAQRGRTAAEKFRASSNWVDRMVDFSWLM